MGGLRQSTHATMGRTRGITHSPLNVLVQNTNKRLKKIQQTEHTNGNVVREGSNSFFYEKTQKHGKYEKYCLKRGSEELDFKSLQFRHPMVP